MYLGVDVGGTKTLLAVLDGHGEIVESSRFPTSKNYDNWLLEVRHKLAHFKNQDFKAAAAGLPGNIDRIHGRGRRMGNLSWKNVPAQYDLEQILHCPVVIENDAKLGALSEAMLLKAKYSKVLYITISTGIGTALVVNGKIDTAFGDGGGKTMLIEHGGRLVPWESFASGRAIFEHYGKLAADITDPASWQRIVRNLAVGLIEVIAMTEPQVVVIGGGVGVHFQKFGHLLEEELKKYHLPLLEIPPLRGAQRPETAVVNGCYDLARQVFSHSQAAHTDAAKAS